MTFEEIASRFNFDALINDALDPHTLVVIHWIMKNGATGHGEPVPHELALSCVRITNVKYGLYSHWMEPVHKETA